MVEDGNYFPRPLEPTQIDRAYPLVREAACSLTIDDWRCYAGDLVSPGPSRLWEAGIMVLEARRRYLRGLFTYQVIPTLCHGPTFFIDCFAVPDSIDRGKIARRLIRGAEAFAARRRCALIQAQLEPSNEWLGRLFGDTGYSEKKLRIFNRCDWPGKGAV